MPLVEFEARVAPRRGEPVEIGNVYQHPWGRPFFRIVFGVGGEFITGRRRFNDITFLHVNIEGEVVGCSTAPRAYVANHCDLVGKVVNMPKLKLKWLTPETAACPANPNSSTSPRKSLRKRTKLGS
jgi:hypothetical protein